MSRDKAKVRDDHGRDEAQEVVGSEGGAEPLGSASRVSVSESAPAESDQQDDEDDQDARSNPPGR